MMGNGLSIDERNLLLQLARKAIEDVVLQEKRNDLEPSEIPERLIEPAATFVTLTVAGELRGCVGGLEPSMPLYQDVMEHAVAAATRDFRFPPVQQSELDGIKIEISRLTPLKRLDYSDPDQLMNLLQPHVDGVLIRHQGLRATFLPQVWEKLPAPEMFLGQLCKKMGVPADFWKLNRLDVFTYQVEEFQE